MLTNPGSSEGRIKGGTAWAALGVVVVLEAVSWYLFLAAAHGSVATLFHADELFETGRQSAWLLRAASISDAAGYLAAIPIALYLRNRFRDGTTIDAATLAGLAFLALGATGALIFAAFGAPLVGDSDYKGLNRSAFELVHRLVFAWVWQSADPLLAALWLIPTGIAARKQRARALAVATIAVGALAIGVLLARLVNVPPDFWPV